MDGPVAVFNQPELPRQDTLHSCQVLNHATHRSTALLMNRGKYQSADGSGEATKQTAATSAAVVADH